MTYYQFPVTICVMVMAFYFASFCFHGLRVSEYKTKMKYKYILSQAQLF